MQHKTPPLGLPRSTARALFVSILAASAMAACSGSASSPHACSPGDTQPCTCQGGASGLQTCDTSGSAYGACVCGDAGDVDSGSADGGVAGYMEPCSYDDGGMGNCDVGLVCFNFPNRGHFCTHTCTVATDCAPPSAGCNGMGLCKAPGA